LSISYFFFFVLSSSSVQSVFALQRCVSEGSATLHL
jgi:hypothetical protein